MNLINHIVFHKVFGEGKIIKHEDKYIIVLFNIGEKKFLFPDAFTSFIKLKDDVISNEITNLIEESINAKEQLHIQKENEPKLKFEVLQKHYTNEKSPKKEKRKMYSRYNIAFKCNFCDGGKSDTEVGFNGVCSDKLIYNNIKIGNRTWCSSEDCTCLRYLNNEITRRELDEMCTDGGFVCYESQMLREWKAMAGVVQTGRHKGSPMKLNQVQRNSLCVLTTRDPHSEETKRYIFAVFLVDETYEGDGKEEGYVSTNSKYKIKLSPTEARKMLFWNYHKNENDSKNARWSSGLHRYFKDEQAAQILKGIADIKIGTAEEMLAQEFFEHFCKINGVDIDEVGEPNGALKLS